MKIFGTRGGNKMETKAETRISDWLIGRKVFIEWKDSSDWHSFKVQEIDIWTEWIMLAGQPQDGDSYTGGMLCVPLDSITSIEIID